VVAPVDAKPVARDAATVKKDAAGVIEDAVVAMPIDAAPAVVDAPVVAETGTIVISNDTWCDVSIDGTLHGRLASVTARIVAKLSPGLHTIACAQPGINPGWSREVTVEAGKSVAVKGSLLLVVEVTIAIAGEKVLIDGVHYPRGAKVKLKPGRRRGTVLPSGVGGFFDIPRVACRLHEVGAVLACDP
jgi:hypothetical protein